MAQSFETAVLGGGCFWCTEAVFLDMQGVVSVEPGYAGGETAQPTYEQICEGDTGHVEVVKVVFDPAVTSYRQILDVFFATHDPTQLNRQGADVGTQYRSVIFTESDEQRRVATELIEALNHAKRFRSPIVTAVEPHDPDNYWPAENYHRNYFEKHPEQGYCSFVVAPKVAKFRDSFPALRKPAA